MGCADELKELVTKHRGEFAAIICEAQRGEKPAPGFLEEVREIARSIGAVLIFDEITSAMRLNTGGVHLLYGVSPDIAVFAKGMGNGFPIAAVIGTADAMEAAQSTFISSTYWTERIGPTAALATIKKYRRLNVPERLIAVGQRVQQIWTEAGETAGLRVHVGPADMPPLSHISYEYPNARAIQTLHCQMMLDRGFLDNTGCYATYAQTDEILDSYAAAVNEVFPLLAKAVRENQVEKLLRGPVGHSGFARLT